MMMKDFKKSINFYFKRTNSNNILLLNINKKVKIIKISN
jgi:hypothetical protein